MKTLLLVRHAQAAPLDVRIQDRDRPLTAFGMQQAAKVGYAFSQTLQQVDLMLVSGAVRTQETAAILQQALQEKIQSYQVRDELYLASDVLLWSLVRGVDTKVSTLLIVGHNPGLEALGARFIPDLEQLPTAGVIEVRFDCASWGEVGESTLTEARAL